MLAHWAYRSRAFKFLSGTCQCHSSPLNKWIKDATTTGTSCKSIISVQSGALAKQWTTSVCTIVCSCCMTLWFLVVMILAPRLHEVLQIEDSFPIFRYVLRTWVLGHFGDWDLLAVLARSVFLFWAWCDTHNQPGTTNSLDCQIKILALCVLHFKAIVANSVDKSHKLGSKSCWQRSHKSREKNPSNLA